MALINQKYTERDRKSQQLEQASQEQANATSKLQVTPSQLFKANHPKPQLYKEPWFYILLIFGLCCVLFLGLTDIAGIDIKNANSSDVYVLAFTYATAWVLCLAIKKMMSIAVRNSYQHNRMIDQKRDTAWWMNLVKGSSAFYLGIFMIILECCFGLPGVFSTIPPISQSNHLLVFAVVAGSCLCAVTNVALGYQVGVEQGISEARIKEWEEKLHSIESSAEQSECIRRNNIYEETIQTRGVTISLLEKKISKLDYEIERLEWREQNGNSDSLDFRSTTPKSPTLSDRNGQVESPDFS